MTGFQLNIVGDFNGDIVTFKSGAGNIQYSTAGGLLGLPTGTLCSSTAPGSSCSNPNFGINTVECSNIVYTGAACCGTSIQQGWNLP